MNFSRWLPAVVVVSVVSCGPGKTMQVNNKPTAAFKATQSSVRPQVFAFDAAESATTIGTLAKFKWTFGDETAAGTTTDLTTPAASHAYKMAGTFTVTLVVEDDKGAASDPVTKDVTVASVNTAGPMAIITGPSSGQPNMQLTFDGSTSTPSGDIQNFEWDFGDGTAKVTGKDKTIVQHTFAMAGSYTVKLTVTDSLAANATATQPVGIGAVGPLAVCSSMPATVSVGTPVMFTGAASTVPAGSSIVSYLWDFGDGVNNVPGALPGGTASHTYTMQGTFTPKLTVTDNAMPRRSHTTSCPQVTVGAPALCNGMYQWMATGGGALCQFVGTTVRLVQNANGTITVTEPGPNGDIVYSGTWTGNTFDTRGTDGMYDYRLRGTFSGCGAWTGTYDTIVDLGGGPQVLCTAMTSATVI